VQERSAKQQYQNSDHIFNQMAKTSNQEDVLTIHNAA